MMYLTKQLPVPEIDLNRALFAFLPAHGEGAVIIGSGLTIGEHRVARARKMGIAR